MTLLNKNHRKVKSHVGGRITKLAEEAIAIGLIAEYALTQAGYTIRKNDGSELQFSSIAAGVYLLQILGKIK
jgi:hypothetical protein